MIQWNDSYRIGVDIVDEQHKVLFNLAEEAEEMMKLPDHLDKFDEIVDIVTSLRDYVKYHFEEEEKILLDIGYKKFFSHKVEHQDFIDYIYKLDLEEIDQHQNEQILELLHTLYHWLVDHVLVQDTHWSQIYKEKHRK